MLKYIQFLYIGTSYNALPAVFLNCGHQSEHSSYLWDGRKRGHTIDEPIVIWQYTISGRGVIEFDGEKHDLPPGSAFLVTVPDDHKYYLPQDSDHWEFVYLTASGSMMRELTRTMQQLFGKVVKHPPDSQLVKRTLDIISQYSNEPLPAFYQASAMIYELWMLLMQELSMQSSSGMLLSLPAATAAYLQKNLHRPDCGVEELAQALGSSRSHFTRKFIAECGMSPGKFLLDWRLEMASRILHTEHCQIKSVAWRTGFADVSHFCRAFRKKFGISPGCFQHGGGKRSIEEDF